VRRVACAVKRHAPPPPAGGPLTRCSKLEATAVQLWQRVRKLRIANMEALTEAAAVAASESTAVAASEAATTVVHEQQHLLHCALHATNNVLQGKHGPRYTVGDFAAIAAALNHTAPDGARFFNPHCSVFGSALGDWGIEVITAALHKRGLALMHYVARPPPSLIGFIVNRPPPPSFLGYWGSNHWVAYAPLAGVWHDLDSKLPAPRRMGAAGTLAEVLAVLAGEPLGSQVLAVCAAAPLAVPAAAAPRGQLGVE
jgi:josephin